MSKRVVIPKNLDKYHDFPDGQDILPKKDFEFPVLSYWKEKKLEKESRKTCLCRGKIQERLNIKELQWSNLTHWI